MSQHDGETIDVLQCVICYGNDGDWSTLLCGHIFHTGCLKRSLLAKDICPTCRAPAKLQPSRGDGKRCPCKSGQPIRLFNIQRQAAPTAVSPWLGGGAAAAARAGGMGGTAGSPLGGSAAAAAATAAVAAERERCARLRGELRDMREQLSALEGAKEAVEAELEAARNKAERRKQRLAAIEGEHAKAVARLNETVLRQEGRERELTEELVRTRQALHSARMELEKARVSASETEAALMRLQRELRLARARQGGAAMAPREVAELLGEHKEDWQEVYSIKVEELRRSQDSVAELGAALARAGAEAEQRLASERLAGAERVKAVAQERDDAKRELLEVEYKLHEALGRLRDLEVGGQVEAGVTAGGGLIGGGGGVTAASRQPATAGALLLPKATHGSACQGQSQQQQQQTHKPPSQRTHQGAALQQHGVRPVLGDRQAQGGSRGESAGSHELQGEEHEPLDRAEEDDEDDEDALLALCEAEERLGLGLGGKEGRWVAEGAGAGRGEGWEEEVEGDDDATQYDRGTAGTEEEGGGAGMEYDEDVPVLPRAFSGVFAGVGGRGAVGAGAARGSAAGGSGVVGAGAAARAAAAAPSVRTVASFAAKGPAPAPRPPGYASGFANGGGAASSLSGARPFGGGGVYGTGGGGSGQLVREGPDGRGGTARFPLVSSFGANVAAGSKGGRQGAAVAAGGAGRGGKAGGGKAGQQGQRPGAASGRIDAFLKPMQR